MENNGKIKMALGIEYDGSAYSGWQSQREGESVQAHVEHALSVVADEPIAVYCAGRTDSGVHATGQIVHFYSHAKRAGTAWTLGVNANLPQDIAIRWAKLVPEDFHARFSAISRRYRYIIYNHRLRPAILNRGLTHYYRPLHIPLMVRSAQYLLGEHDFTSFRALHCQSSSPYRTVHRIHISRQGRYVILDIQANAFLYRMVRNIVGSLLEVGSGKRQVCWVNDLLKCCDRTRAGATAQAQGLYMVQVKYPACFKLPKTSLGPLFLTDQY